MSAPRGLSEEEVAAWDKLAATVTPLHPVRAVRQPLPALGGAKPAKPDPVRRKAPAAIRQPARPAPSPPPPQGLDSHWDRRLKAGSIQPDLTLDLHGHNLDMAYDRLMGGVAQARALGMRTILLVTGKPRPVEAADRMGARGAIRAKVLDWLAASSHHSAIAAVRRADQRHGGDGALYIVLKRER
ncbi:Smr/MutS family protein [Qipengyuania sp. 6B39]|uniref:Smr/MutS family protein n=1 Tax=Qipengyuania proteolytica TaxID=2867239 RepID=UPI001C899872|nr:Smr/MutS family protein [Qipengyuania proteolytica]MBX7494962.1 Smr/MutS family protein [Qipengyuania proteolytica]